MVVLRILRQRLRGLFQREPAADAWILPGNEVTRAVESGRNLAAYAERPAAAALPVRPALPAVESFAMDGNSVLDQPTKKIVISDDAVHGAVAEAPLLASDKPLEATKGKKRWWRRAA